MRKGIACVVFFLFWTNAFAQNKDLYAISSGKISFFSYAPQEIIKATSSSVKGLINTAQNTFAISVDNASFLGFNSDLQKEHFNERFIETETFSNCTFSGKIIDKFDWNTNGLYKVRVKGKLMVHGITQERVIPVTIQVNSGTLQVIAVFNVLLSDHDISIPSIVNQKIAEEIEVTFKANFTRK